MALRRYPVVLGIALALGSFSTSAVGASQPVRGFGAFAAARHGTIADAIRRAPDDASGGAITPADVGGIGASSLCWERDYTDPAGDAPIDATAYRLTYDCPSGTWRLSATLAAPLDPATFDSFAIEIDTDNDANNGCDGFDFLVAGVFATDGSPKGVLVSTPACDSSTWTTVSTAGFSVSGTSLALSYSENALGNAHRLVWNAGVVPLADSAAVDSLPDTGVLVADHFAQQTSAHDGYWLADAAGGVHAYGNAPFHGDLAGDALTQPIVGIVRAGHHGYWLIGRDGGVFSFGGAAYHGSTGGLRLNRPVVAIGSPSFGRGYWLVASDGGVFSFGDAAFHGSTGALHLNQPIVGIASTPSGKGYWLVASDGGIFSFGDAAFRGSTGALHLNQPIVGMASTPSGDGYWLVASDGGIFSFGDAAFLGSAGATHLASPIVGMKATPTGLGYRFVASDGGIFSFGDADFLGGLGGGTPPSPVVGIG